MSFAVGYSFSDEKNFERLVEAAWKVKGFLMDGLKVSQVGMFMEGFEIDYARVKLTRIPNEHMEPENATATYFHKYQGFLTTQPGPQKE
jgi:hypothetical protein